MKGRNYYIPGGHDYCKPDEYKFHEGFIEEMLKALKNKN